MVQRVEAPRAIEAAAKSAPLRRVAASAPGILVVRPARCLVVLLAVIAGLCLASIAAEVSRSVLGQGGFNDLFNVDREVNVPAWYSAGALLAAALLLAGIAAVERARRDPFVVEWGVLSACFVYLSADEAAGLHEEVVLALEQTGYGTTAARAVLPMVVALVLAAFFWRFLLRLPRRTGLLFLVAAGLLALGAVGGDTVSMLGKGVHGKTLAYAALSTLEELLEMCGVALFLYALLSYLVVAARQVQLRIEPAPVLLALAVPAALLTAAVLLAELTPAATGSQPLVRVFGIGGRFNLPSWYASSALLVAAALLALPALVRQPAGGRARAPWVLLVGVVLGLSLVELVDVRGRLAVPLLTALAGDRLPPWTWALLPLGAASLGLIGLRPLLRVPEIRRGLAVAAGCYLASITAGLAVEYAALPAPTRVLLPVVAWLLVVAAAVALAGAALGHLRLRIGRVHVVAAPTT